MAKELSLWIFKFELSAGKQSAMAFCRWCVLLPLLTAMATAEVEVHLLHLNDLHSRFAPINFRGVRCRSDDDCIGGVARIKKFVSDVKNGHIDDFGDNGNKDGVERRVFFLNAGDLFQGTVWYSMFKWWIVSNLTSSLGFTASSLGNHEFDDGVDDLIQFAKSVDYPLLACNLDLKSVPILKRWIECSTLVEIDENGHKMAILGYVTPETRLLASTGEVVFLDEVESLKKEIEYIKRRFPEVTMFVALGHSGYEMDLRIAREIPELDVVIGGHTNTFLWNSNYEKPTGDREKPFGPYPTIVNHTSKATLVVQTSGYGKYLGHLKLWIDSENGLIKHFEGRPVLMDNKYGEDEDLKLLVNHFGREVEIKMGVVVGQTSTFIDGGRPLCRLRECDMGNFVSDAMREAMNAQIAVINSGAIKASLPAGNVSMGDVKRAMPWANTVDLVRIPGSTLLRMLEHSVSDYDANHPDPGGKFLQMSGLRVEFDVHKEPGDRVVSVAIKDFDDDGFEALDESAIYTVSMLSYMVHGGDGYSMVPETMVEHRNTGYLDSDLIVAYLANKNVVDLPKGDRILFAGDPKSDNSGPNLDLEAISMAAMFLNAIFMF